MITGNIRKQQFSTVNNFLQAGFTDVIDTHSLPIDKIQYGQYVGLGKVMEMDISNYWFLCVGYLTVILRTRVVYELIADEVRITEFGYQTLCDESE